MKTTAKTGKVVAAFPVEEDREVIIITQQAKLIRLSVDKIRETGRSAQGVMLIRTGNDDIVTSASLIDIADAEDIPESVTEMETTTTVKEVTDSETEIDAEE